MHYLFVVHFCKYYQWPDLFSLEYRTIKSVILELSSSDLGLEFLRLS